jgi:putative nucleotidyltransferase with HDIG domain
LNRGDGRSLAVIAVSARETGKATMEEKDKANAIPSKEACFELLETHNVPEHIINHSIQVHKIALYLSKLLNEKGEGLDIAAVEAAALLHDITKMESFRTGKNHALTGADLLRRLGYGLIGDIVENHIVIPELQSQMRITEYELVNYSDKRVMHYKVVTLEERFLDILKRYGKNEKSRIMMDVWKERALKLERKIFSRLDISPAMLLDL